jgi:cytochrome b pre-mRNA-processing protein 3
MPPTAKRKTGAAAANKRKGPMLTFLFRRLTAAPSRGAELFDAVTGLAREPHWYVEGKVPDTLDDRFTVLATITALVLVRLEGEGEPGDSMSVALTERFIHVMESEHRELGIGDPTLGKTMRKLVGSLARRVELWRSAANGGTEWETATRDSIYKSGVSAGALEHASEALKRLWAKLQGRTLTDIDQGKLQ